MPTTVRSFSKINLGLAVGPPRSDGFHGLTTLYQTLALHDLVTVSAKSAHATTITLSCDREGKTAQGVPQTSTGDAVKNTAFRIVAETLKRRETQAEVHIHIDKRLPVQGGLGAGSANAAAALLGLERELNLALPAEDRLALAAEIGSDVPLFLLGGTVLGLGRGEQVFPLPDFAITHCVVAIPSVGVSTAAAFRRLDARAGLTFQQLDDRLEELSRVLSGVFTITGKPNGPSGIGPHATDGNAIDLAEPLLALVRTGVENDFEEVAFSEYPLLRDILRALQGPAAAPDATMCRKAGGGDAALYAALAGSGSSLFGLYSSKQAAAAAQQRVRQTGADALLTETLPRPEYWKRMFAE